MTTATSSESFVATEDDQYSQLLACLRDRFAETTAGRTALFTTAVSGLFDAFLGALPPDRRQHYTCNACRRFVDRFGSLVAVGSDGTLVAALWSPEAAPSLFRAAVLAMAHAVSRAKISGVFLSAEPTWGMPQNKSDKEPFLWRHMAVVPARTLVHKPSPLQTTGQAAAEKLQDYGTLCRGLAEFPPEVVRQAHTLLSTGQLYRSEKCIGVARWLLDLHEARGATSSSTARDNLTWLAVANAPAGFCHVRSGMIGTLLEDIQAGLPFEDIKRRFDEKMSPANYQRAQAAPSAGNIAQAEKVIATLEAAGALGRRYATLEDLQLLWRPQPPRPVATAGGVFGHLTPKAKAAPSPLALPTQTMTWDKFRRTVLGNAIRVDLQVPASSDRFMALVTAVNPEAPPILQWDSEERRNPVSWYYAGGIDAEIKKRVLGAGGMHDNVDIRASLIWNNRNDLDLHVVTPRGEHIYFAAKRSTCDGWLDVDMNVRGETDTPVENIRWAKGAARVGRYQVYVQNYRFHEHTQSPTPFRVELEVNGDVFHFGGVVSPHRQTRPDSDVVVAEFNYHPGQKLTEVPRGLRAPQASGANAWSLVPAQWTRVSGIVESPNLWGDQPMRQHGQHMFFLLDGCKDTAQGVGRGFFVETLRGEYRPIRSTLEAFAASATIAGAEGASACGIGMNDQAPWDLVLRVTTADGASTYKLDRWD
jgi:hypothetical protein